MRKNRYGVDGEYFNKKLQLVIRDMEHYKPTELLREFSNLMDAVRPMDNCAKCDNRALVIFDQESNECLECQNIQNVKGT